MFNDSRDTTVPTIFEIEYASGEDRPARCFLGSPHCNRCCGLHLSLHSGDGDFLRALAGVVLQILIEADVEGLIGAGVSTSRRPQMGQHQSGCRRRA